MKRFGLEWVAVVVCGLAWAGIGVAVGQAGTKADSSAALRNDKQEAPAADRAKRPMTFADMMAMKRVSDPQISPTGGWVLFSVTDVSLEKNTKVNHLWVVPLSGGGGTNYGDSSPTAQNDSKKNSGQNDTSKSVGGDPSGERQATFGEGETFGRFSPDGKWVSMTIGGQIYVAGWDEFHGTVGAPVLVTGTEIAGGADGAIWSPDSKRLMFVADVWPECSVKGGGGTETNAGILRSAQNDNSGGAVARDLSAWKTAEPATWAEENACDEARDKAADASAVKGQVWEGLLYRHWDQYTGQKRSHVLVRDVEGTHVRDLTPASAVGDAETPTWTLEGVQDYAWAPDSKEIAYATNLDPVPAASTNNDVFTLRLDEAGAKAVKVSTSPGSDDEPEYSPDGKWLAFRSQARAGFESDRFRLMLFDREKKTIKEALPEYRDVRDEPVNDNWVDEFAWAQDSSGLVYVMGSHGEEDIHFVPMDQNKHPMSSWSAVGGEFSEVSLSKDGSAVASLMKVNQPTEIVVVKSALSSEKGYDIAIRNTNVSSLTHVNELLLSQVELSPLESFWFAGAEGTKVEGFLLKPPGFDAAKKYPVKFLMHGGPQTAWGDAWSYRWNWELMAASGYVVVGINRRGSTGYGQKFVDEVSGDWGGRAYEDLMKGLDYAEAHYPFLDKTRECALGASYGGYMADWVLTHTNRFQCIVTHDGMYDPVSAYGDTEEMWFNEWEFRRPEDFPKGWDGFSAGYDPMGHSNPPKQSLDGASGFVAAPGSVGGHAAEPWRYQDLPADEDPFRRWSPMRFIENAKTPTLVVHSQRDMRLDVSQGFELFTALQRRGVPSKFLYFPDEGHWVLKPQNAELWNAVVGDWCDRWTKTGKYSEAGNRDQETGNR